MKKKMAAWIILGIVTVIAGLGLALTNSLTKDTIAQRSEMAANATRNALLSSAERFETMALPEGAKIDALYTGYVGDEAVGYVVKKTVQGYGGPIELMIGTDVSGRMFGVNAGGSDFAETAGLGSKVKDEAFIGQYRGLTAPVGLNKEVDAISGATISSSAVNNGVNTALEALASLVTFKESTAAMVKKEADPLLASVYPDAGSLKAHSLDIQSAWENDAGAVVTAHVKGFQSAFDVTVGMLKTGEVTGIHIGEGFGETDGYGTRCLEPAFAESFKGVTEATVADVDVVSGASVTSGAVKKAVAMALEYGKANMGVGKAAIAVTQSPDDASATASKKGYNGPVAAAITVNADGYITSLVVGNDRFDETSGLGSKVREEAFTSQFIGRKPPIAITDIDAISGATISSQAAVNAVNAAYEKIYPAEEATPAAADAAPAAGAAGADAASAGSDTASGGNTATASKKGYGGPVAATITVDENGAIASLVIGNDRFSETEGLGSKVKDEAFTSQFIGKKPPIALSDIDAISGATISSEAAVNAVNAAYEKIAPKEEAAAAPAPASAGSDAASAGGNTATASKKGYGGPVAATITVDENGAIASLVIGNDRFSETEGLGSKVKDEAFTSQFIGKKPPIALSDIDAISGATISSEAAVNAVNAAYEKIFPTAQ